MREHFSRLEQWRDGAQRLEEQSGDAGRYARLLEQLDAVTDELRRRVGQTFTLRELGEAYVEADVWARDVVADVGGPGWLGDVAMVQDAAFHLYARGARDYVP